MVYEVQVSADTKDPVLLWSGIAGIVAAVVVLLDFLLNRWRYIKQIAIWIGKNVRRLKPDPTIVTLDIPPPPMPAVAAPIETPDGASKTIVRYIIYGQDQLLAYTSTREGFPGTRFLIERNRPSQTPQSLQTSDRDLANAKWNEWYQEWKRKGFGGASGTGLSGEPPF